MRKDFKIVLIDPIIPEEKLYFINGSSLSQEYFEEEQFKDLLTRNASIVSYRIMTISEVLEKYGDILSKEEIERLKNHKNVDKGKDIGVD